MSKERARRREARLAESARRRRTAERRANRGKQLRTLRDRLPRRRHVVRLGNRRSRAQLAGVGVGLTLVLLLTWYFTDSWPVRIAVAVLSLIALPAILTLTLDRSTR